MQGSFGDLAQKPWVRKLIAQYDDLRFRRLLPCPPWAFWTVSGGDSLFFDIQKVREEVGCLAQNPVVYYAGCGNIGRLNIDIIYPLLATNFSKLVAADIGPREPGSSFNKFIQAVTLNLSFIDEIDQERISFKQFRKNKFLARFVYEGIPREIHFYAQFDATLNWPEELEEGYQAFFTRKANALFAPTYTSRIPEAVRDGFLKHLAPGGLLVFQEIVRSNSDFRQRILELKNWLGDGYELCRVSQNNDYLFEKLSCFKKL